MAINADIFDRLPRPAALLLLSSILHLTNAHVLQHLPRRTPAATITIPHRPLNVVSWPLLPTPPPGGLLDLRRRQESTICGYIGGDSALPATCSSGSHCVLDTEHNVVGCCPDGAPSCTAGVFTGCVDANSGPQTEVNPYVYSCTGAAVCYKNMFDGGFSQWGCGTASDQATSVAASANGLTGALAFPTVSVSYTESISTLSEPTTLGTITSKPTSRASSSSASSSSSSSSPSSSSTPSSSPSPPSSTVDPAPVSSSAPSGAPSSTDSSQRTGAIVGGTIGGLAMLIAVVGIAFFFVRRRNGNVRQGPGPGGARGKRISPPTAGGGTGFSALAQDGDAYETGPAASVLNQPPPPMAIRATTALPPPSSSRNLLTPVATGPPMPFQNEVSPVVDDHDHEHDPDVDDPFRAAALASVSSYPPSSSGGMSAASAAAGYNYTSSSGQGQYPSAYYGGGSGGGGSGGGGSGSGFMGMGMKPVLLNRGPERHLESDQVPLTSGMGSAGGYTREIDDFSHGYHAALGRIGEEDEDGEDEVMQAVAAVNGSGGGAGVGAGAGAGAGQGYRDHQGGHPGPLGDGLGAAAAAAGADSGGGTGSHDSADSGSARPLWQQNRRQSRNLMWM